jgi:hypothetical protein
MWLFTRYGFYSVACASKADGTIDTASLMIRARSFDHLKNLQARFPALASTEILVWPNRDYRYRIIVPKSAWALVVTELAEEQEWSNFKNETAHHQGSEGSAYVHALHEVWDVMNRFQANSARKRKPV